MGTCDRETGQCMCREGFNGRACSRLSCPNDCSQHGVCQDMSHFASVKDPGTGEVFAYDGVWDSDKVFGCRCDDGFFGPDCSLRHCPRGDDPLTGTAIDPAGIQRNEVQSLTCRADGGYFTLSFRGATTAPVYFDDSLAVVKAKLLALPSLHGADVETTGTAGVCEALGNLVQVRFTQDFGDVPLLVGDAAALKLTATNRAPKLTIREEIAGEKEDVYCSGRGLCNTRSGVCDCFDHYATSDGYGRKGGRGDCGYSEVDVTQCPGEVSCSGHGTCRGYPTYACECADGWQGGDCSERVCPAGKAWFGLPTAEDRAHGALAGEAVECSAQGSCDRASGECACHELFEGAACERLRCPSGPSDNGALAATCSGHGQCLTMAKLALEATTRCDDEYCHRGDATSVTYGATPNDPRTWDHDMVQGCLCDDGWQGFDCGERRCPYGDDPHTPYSWVHWNPSNRRNAYKDQVNEEQAMVCTASSGGFYLSFRGAQTARLTHGLTMKELEKALEALPTIEDVEVKIENDPNRDEDRPICDAAGVESWIEFKVPTGDVPMLRYQLDGVSDIAITERYQGTKEYEECSGRGLCDRDEGACQCFPGFGSSDGQGGVGDRADCGYSRAFAGYVEDAVACQSAGGC